MSHDPFTTLALLGTEKYSSPPPPPHPVLAEAWNRLDWAANPRRAMLRAAALAGAARTAGAQSAPVGAPPAAAPGEQRPVCSPAAQALLQRMMEGQLPDCLGEWLRCCALAGQLVHPRWLPALLRQAAREKTLRPLIEPVAGERGFWLARLNPDWGFLVNPSQVTESEWETGSAAERLAYFAQLRQRDPAQARSILAATWPQDPSEFKAACLVHLAVHLDMADVPLLEQALADRRKEVRQPARALLARLPDSPFARRCRERAEGLLIRQKKLFRQQLKLVLPAVFDPAWKADGIEEKPPAGVGEKAFWCQQILGLTPVRHWCNHFQLSPVALLEANTDSEWSETILWSLVESALLIPDAEVAAVLAGQASNLVKRKKGKETEGHDKIITLFRQCQGEDQWLLLEEMKSLATPNSYQMPLYCQCLRHTQGEFNPERSRTILRHLAPLLREGMGAFNSSFAATLALRLSPIIQAEAATLLAKEGQYTTPAETMLQTLEFRAAIRQAFGTGAPNPT